MERDRESERERERERVEIFLGVRGSLYRGVRERERKRDTRIASIGWGCDRAGLRGGGFIVVFWAYRVVDFGPFFLGLFGFWC